VLGQLSKPEPTNWAVKQTLAVIGHSFGASRSRVAQAWHDQHPSRQAELAGARAALGERRAAIDRYLRAFEAGRLSEAACGERLTDLDREARALEARTTALEAECETIPAVATDDLIAGVRQKVERAVADGTPQQLKRLLGTVVEQILVDSRAFIQPYFAAPTVRTRLRSRRRRNTVRTTAPKARGMGRRSALGPSRSQTGRTPQRPRATSSSRRPTCAA
jgi:hypothetical protein